MATKPISHKTQNPLHKQHSWSPDILRDEAWTNRLINNQLRRDCSVTYDDFEELRACLDMGFGFESPDLNSKLFSTLPALDMYLNSQFDDKSTLFRLDSDLDSVASFCSIIDPGEDSETLKTKLKEWARVVASSLRHLSSNNRFL